MAMYYIGADVHGNNKELAIEQRGKIVARYSVPTTIPAISPVLNSLQGKKNICHRRRAYGRLALREPGRADNTISCSSFTRQQYLVVINECTTWPS